MGKKKDSTSRDKMLKKLAKKHGVKIVHIRMPKHIANRIGMPDPNSYTDPAGNPINPFIFNEPTPEPCSHDTFTVSCRAGNFTFRDQSLAVRFAKCTGERPLPDVHHSNSYATMDVALADYLQGTSE